jgi:hypothetical protein
LRYEGGMLTAIIWLIAIGILIAVIIWALARGR